MGDERHRRRWRVDSFTVDMVLAAVVEALWLLVVVVAAAAR